MNSAEDRRSSKLDLLQQRRIQKLNDALKSMTSSALVTPTDRSRKPVVVDKKKHFRVSQADSLAAKSDTVHLSSEMGQANGRKQSPNQKTRQLTALRNKYPRLNAIEFMRKPEKHRPQKKAVGEILEDLPVTRAEVLHFVRFVDNHEAADCCEASKLSDFAKVAAADQGCHRPERPATGLLLEGHRTPHQPWRVR